MASCGGDEPPDPNDSKWNFKFNPFAFLGVSSENPDPDEVRRAYRARIRDSHPDKASGKEGLAKKLTVAYNYLKTADAAKLKNLAKQFSAPGGGCGEGGGAPVDLSNVLVDKTRAEHYRRLFKAHVNVAKETEFRDNFQSFYKQCFDNVVAFPEEKPGYRCEYCEEDWLCEEDHFEVVYAPYMDYVLEGAKPGCVEYLESLLGAEVVSWVPPNDEMSVACWTSEVGSTFKNIFATMKELKSRSNWKMEVDPFGVGGECAELWKCLVNCADQEVVDICTKVINEFTTSLGVKVFEVSRFEWILVAFLMVFKDFKRWSPLAQQTARKSPHLSLTLEYANTLDESGAEDNFLRLGEIFVECQNFDYAHMSFLLGGCDLSQVAIRMLTLSAHVECKQLAAYYLAKTKDTEQLRNQIRTAKDNRDMITASIFAMALFKQQLMREDFDGGIATVGEILSREKHWKFIQSLVVDIPELILSSSGVASAAATRICGEFQGQGQGNAGMEFLEHLLGVRLNQVVSVPSRTFHAISGALHLVNEDNPGEAGGLVEQIRNELRTQLDVKMKLGDAEFVLGLTRIPGIGAVLRAILEHKQFLGVNAATPQPGSNYHSCLVLLRAVYHYKTRHYSKMAEDFALASMITLNNQILKAVANFLVANPMIHEKILKTGGTQWEQLQSYVENYTGEPLDAKNFREVLQSTIAKEEPYISAVINVGGNRQGPDVMLLEKDILGRGHADGDDEDAVVSNSVAGLAEKGFNFVDLEVICKGRNETVCCLGMAANYFLQAMKATADSDIATKFGYRGLILEILKDLKGYTSTWSLPVPTAFHALRASVSFAFTANQHFSETLRKTGKGNGITSFIDESTLPEQTNQWQNMLSLRTLCPVLTSDIYSIAEGRLALSLTERFWDSWVLEKINSGLYSGNAPDYLYYHALFNGIWNQNISPEDTGYEPNIPDAAVLSRNLEKIDEENDSEEEKARKTSVNQSIQEEIRRIGEMQRELKATPLVDRIGFHVTRENSIEVLASLYGYQIEDIERMMNWPVIRRTPEGFIDMSNRTLNFDGVDATHVYSRFLGVQMNPNGKSFHLVLEQAVPGDPNRPALFSSVDLAEIFGNRILSGFVSFEEQLFPPDSVGEHLKLVIPFHPFFKVKFLGVTPDGANKESVCGTNFLMTLYWLDLLAKIFTTGQEVGANFPFPFQSTETGLLKDLSQELRDVLKPIGPRKKVKNLRALEWIHRFWFAVEEVEQEIVQGSQVNGGVAQIKYGKGSVLLKTKPMIRGVTGELEDADDLIDDQSPEAKFVRGFNEKLHLIEKEFPVIQRVKELAKISQCLSILLSNQTNLENDIPAFKSFMQMKLPNSRPFSKCGTPGKLCTCCDWVPAVYHQMKVTDEQKLEYLFEEKFSMKGEGAIESGQVGRLEFEEGKAEQPSSSSGGGGKAGETGKKTDDKKYTDLSQYDRLEEYRCYGGVSFQPTSKDVQNIPTSGWRSVVTWENALDVALFAAQFIPAVRVASFLGRIGTGAMRVLRAGSCFGGGGGGGGRQLVKIASKALNTTNKHRLDYVGPTWVYGIRPKGGVLTGGKIGITSVGPNAKGQLQRAQRQVAKMNREAKKSGSNVEYEYFVKKQVYGSKLEARAAEAKMTNFLRGKNSANLPLEKGAHPESLYK